LISQVSNSATAATTSGGSSSSSSLTDPSSDLFLKILVAELKTQDPTSPLDPNQMVGQMLSMNQLNELIQIRQLLQGVSSTTPGTGSQPNTGASNA